jgi:TPR repeat protein
VSKPSEEDIESTIHDKDVSRYAPQPTTDVTPVADDCSDEVSTSSEDMEQNETETLKLQKEEDSQENVSEEAETPCDDECLPKTVYCKYCGKPVDEDSSFCKYCGGDLRDIKTNAIKAMTFGLSKIEKIIAFALLLLWLFFIVSYVFNLKYYYYGLSDELDNLIAPIVVSVILWGVYAYLYIKANKKWKVICRKVTLFLTAVSLIIVGSYIMEMFHCVEYSTRSYRESKALNSDNREERLNYIYQKFEGYSDPKEIREIMGRGRLFEVIDSEAENGDPFSQGLMGEYYYTEVNNIKRKLRNKSIKATDDNIREYYDNLDRALYWWIKAADNGDARGLYRLGNCYARIIEIPEIEKDLSKSYEYWTKASEKGFGMAYKRLGDLFGTWDYLDGFEFYADDPEIKGVNFSKDGKGTQITFNLPSGWAHNIKLARKYWEQATKCGGDAAEEAKKCLEKVYPEEIRRMQEGKH